MALGLLVVIGVVYLALGAWCAISPQSTAAALGYPELSSGARSEYLVLYGGMQAALGIVFLSPVFGRAETQSILWVCLVVHAAIVVFRTSSYFLYPSMPLITQILTGIEWTIFLTTLFVWWKR